MRFENNDFMNTLANFGLDMSNYIGSLHNDDYKHHGYGHNHDNFSDKFIDSNEGFQRGNLYKHEYKPYKNMTYIPYRPKNEKEEKLYKVYEYSFAITDLSFHLDLNPEDKNSFELFKKYVREYETAKKEYERIYGPLCITDATGQVYDWVDNPWPWDKDKGDMYV